METRSLVRIGIAVLALSIPQLVFAAGFSGPLIPEACHCPGLAPGWGCVLQVVQNVINFAVYLATLAATLAVAYAGFIWMTSGGDPGKRKKGRTMLFNILLGLALLLSAWLIVDFVMKALYNPDTQYQGGPVFGPWNSILASTGDDQCLKESKQVPITTGLVSIVAGVTPGTSSGSGNNCPAANPAGMVAFPAAASSGGSYTATPQTVNNFLAMRAAALKDGIDLKVISGYRTEAQQLQLWDEYGHDTSQVAKPCSIEGGTGSNHNSGTAVDINVGCAKTNSSCSSPAFKWLKAHGSQWGFNNALSNDVVHWSPSGN